MWPGALWPDPVWPDELWPNADVVAVVASVLSLPLIELRVLSGQSVTRRLPLEIHERATVRFPLKFIGKDDAALPLDGHALFLDLKKPDDTLIEVTPTPTNVDSSDGLAEYTTVATDLVGEGEWELQGWATIGGSRYPSDVHRFTVRANLKDR